MRIQFLVLALSLFSATPALADITACAVRAPEVCATIRNLPELRAGKAISFDVEMSAPVEKLDVEFVWDSAELELRIISVPEKITNVDTSNFAVKKVIMIFDGVWNLDLYATIRGQKYWITVPVEVTQ